MPPERLSNGICSLNPDVDRLCLVCDLALDKSGKPLQTDIYEAVMRSHARLTYDRVAEALAGDPDPQARPLLDDLKAAHELSKKLTGQRRARGSIDFDLPEAKIVLDDEGKVAEIVKRPRNDAHRLIEEFMLAANEGVARFFEVRALPTVYRIHDQPDREKLEAFAALARSHGFELPSGEELTPRVLNGFLKAVEGTPAQKAVNAGVAAFGLFCELEEVFVEGLIRAESLGEGVRLDKEKQRLVVGSSGLSYSIGDEVLVEVVSADPARRRITLALADDGAAKS